MRSISIIALLFLFTSLSAMPEEVSEKQTITVPGDFPTIAEAVANSNEGDWIIISPGEYIENEIEVNKALTISSEWKISGDESKIDQTIIDAGDLRLFIISADGVEISGLKIINGDHTLDISAKVSVTHNHFINNLDGMSFEGGGGGYVAYNYAENDRDDPLDLDITRSEEEQGSDIVVEHNTFINSNDDGIEIRLFTYPDQNIQYTIRENKIIGSNNAGIQLISYDKYTGKVFHIHHNTITYCKSGLGCMEGANTGENMGGATKMDEQVFFYNNTLVGNKMGATGGNNIIAFNNLVANNTLGGFKLFGPNSAIRNNLFFQNGGSDFIDIDMTVISEGNIFDTDPLLDRTSLFPSKNSPCIDAGAVEFELVGKKNVKVSPDHIAGNAPDIGAHEYGIQKEGVQQKVLIQVDAGEDKVIESPASQVILAGRVRNNDHPSCDFSWRQEKGPSEAKLRSPEQLVTEATLDLEGIYQFSINCTDGKSTVSDNVTIRYINDGDGNQIFLGEQETNTIEAEEFAYSYGKVKEQGKKYLKLEAGETVNEVTQVEFSVGMAEGKEYDLWFLIKSLSPDQNKIAIEFNHQVVGEIPVLKDKKFHWVKVPGKVLTTPGQWPLLIVNQEGSAVLDRMILTSNPA
jgi:hypothetical protein